MKKRIKTIGKYAFIKWMLERLVVYNICYKTNVVNEPIYDGIS